MESEDDKTHIRNITDRPEKGEGSDHDSMKTLSSCTRKAAKDGYTVQFKAHGNGLESLDSHALFKPEEVKIVNFYRFEGESDPEDNAILYLLETNSGEKGTLIDAYGVYTDLKVSEFVKKVEEIQKANTTPPSIEEAPESQEAG